MGKIAILQVADTGPLESLVVMLRSVGYNCHLPNEALKRELRAIGCDTVLDVEGLVKGWGYEEPFLLPEAGIAMMGNADLYVDIKAHRNGPIVWEKWPRLKGRTLWYRINGGKPEHVVNQFGDCGDEMNLPCPVLTPNQWYKDQYGDPLFKGLAPWWGRAYVCWPPFFRFDDYFADTLGRPPTNRGYSNPVCLIHNISGWGYRDLIEPMRNLGVKCHGAGSPDGLIPHAKIPQLLSNALCTVHLKSSDAPGYALYESLTAACPIICTRRLIWRCRMQDLLIPNETCLVFDRETHEGLTPQDVADCLSEVRSHLTVLANPEINRRIGVAGRNRLKALMWNDRSEADISSLKTFMERNFP